MIDDLDKVNKLAELYFNSEMYHTNGKFLNSDLDFENGEITITYISYGEERKRTFDFVEVGNVI